MVLIVNSDIVENVMSISHLKLCLKLTNITTSMKSQSSGISPASTICCSICRNFAATRRPTAAAWRWAASLSFVCLPCLRLASEMRCKPRWVLGPVDWPPCNWQRVLPLRAGLRQAVPRRVLAPQRWPGQVGPNCQGIPFLRLKFALKATLCIPLPLAKLNHLLNRGIPWKYLISPVPWPFYPQPCTGWFFNC